jgi:hypothetical protein
MLNGLALRNGFQPAPKVRKNQVKYSASTSAHCRCEEVAARHIWDISERPEVRGNKAVSKDRVVLTQSPSEARVFRHDRHLTEFVANRSG